MGNKFCTCHDSEKHGQTSVMCCNKCGLPDEEFWHNPSPSDRERELEKEVERLKGLLHGQAYSVWKGCSSDLTFEEWYKLYQNNL